MRKREERREERGIFIYDEARTLADAMLNAFNKREQEEKIKLGKLVELDRTKFRDEIHKKHLSLRACGVKISDVDPDVDSEIFKIFRVPFNDVLNNPLDWIFTCEHYNGDSILDTSAVELCSHILQAQSKDKNTLLDFAKSLNGALGKIQDFILESYSNYSKPYFPYFEVLDCEHLPDQTSDKGYPAAFFRLYYSPESEEKMKS